MGYKVQEMPKSCTPSKDRHGPYIIVVPRFLDRIVRDVPFPLPSDGSRCLARENAASTMMTLNVVYIERESVSER